MRTFKWMAIVMLAACGGGGKKPAAKPDQPMADEKPATSEPAKSEASAPVAAPKKEEPPPMTMAQKAEKGTKAFVAAWNAHDVDAVVATYDADATLSAGTMQLHGRDAIKGPVQGELTAFPDFKAGIPRVITKDNVVVLEWVVTGTNTGDAPDMKATKRPVGLHGVDVLTFADSGLIKEDHRYFDQPTQMMQLDAKAKKGTFRPVAEQPSGETVMLASKGGDDEQKNLDAVNAMYKAFGDHKVDAALATMDKDIEGDDYSQPAVMKGTKAAKAYLTAFFKAVPDLKQDNTVQFAAGDLVVTEGVLNGTLKGNLGPLKATKKPIALHFVDIIQVKDGKAVKLTSYADSGELMPPPAPKADAKKADGKKEPAKKPAK